MGYESRIYVWDRHKELDFSERIAMFNLCKMGDFCSIFDKKIDFTIYAEDGNTKIEEDYYGDALTYTSLVSVIDYLEKQDKSYRRITPCLNMLKGFNEYEWEDLIVVHFGY
jgi:hypothetical protein